MNLEKEILKLKRDIDRLMEEVIFRRKTSDIIKKEKKLTRSELKRKCHFANKKMLDSLLEILVRDGKIRVWRNIGTVKQAEQIEWIGKDE